MGRDIEMHGRAILELARQRRDAQDFAGAEASANEVLNLKVSSGLLSEARGLKRTIAGESAKAAAAAARRAREEAERERRGNAELELIRWSWSTTASDSYVEARGLVKNISGRALDDVEAVLLVFDAQGNFITSDETLIDYRPLLPGQTSPFHVLLRYNPAMRRASIQFKEFSGRQIPTYER